MAEITPTTGLVVEIPETSENPTQPSLITKCKLYFFFQKHSRILSARFTLNAISSYWGTIGRLGELILMLENHAMGPDMPRDLYYI